MGRTVQQAPLVFADTLGYATAALRREVPGLFSIFYSVLILPLHQGVTLWPVVFVQGAMLAHLLYLTTRCVSGSSISKPETLLIISRLVRLFKPAMDHRSDYAGCVLPRLLLGMFLLAFCNDQLRRGELFYVGRLMTAGITTHFSHVPIAFGLIFLWFGLRLIFGQNTARIRPWAALLLIPFVVAVCSMLAVNWVDSRAIGFARNSNVFLLAKWIDEGPALSYLRRACPTAGYALCAHVEELEGLTHDDLKWGWNSPFKKIGTFDELEPEARSIVWATLRAHPLEIVQRAIVMPPTASAISGRRWAISRFRENGCRASGANLWSWDVAKSLIQSRQGEGRCRSRKPVGSILSDFYLVWVFASGRYWRGGGSAESTCCLISLSHRNFLERNRDRGTVRSLRSLPGAGHLARELCWAARALLYRSSSSPKQNSAGLRLTVRNCKRRAAVNI